MTGRPLERPKPEDLVRWIADALRDAPADACRGLEVAFHGQASDVADGTAVLLLRDRTRRPRAVALCSSPVAPDMVLRATTRARAAKEALGPELGAPILEPLAEGRAGGLSFAVWTWCHPLAESGPRWALQRTLLREPLLDWLWRATARTSAAVAPEALEAEFDAPLRHLAALAPLPGPIRAAAEAAAGRLRSGAWVPRHAVMHGDLWKGNVLVKPRAGAERAVAWRRRFAIIDWPGSAVAGHPIYDLVRLGLSLRLPPRRLRAEVERHCRALRCDPEDAPSHLLAALGHLSLHLERFPPERFVQLAAACHAALARAAR